MGISNGRCLVLTESKSICWIDISSQSLLIKIDSCSKKGTLFKDRAIIIPQSDPDSPTKKRDVAIICDFDQKNHFAITNKIFLKNVSTSKIGFYQERNVPTTDYASNDDSLGRFKFVEVKMVSDNYFVAVLQDVQHEPVMLCVFSLKDEKVIDIVDLPNPVVNNEVKYLPSFVLFENSLVFTLDDHWEETMLYIYNLCTDKITKLTADVLYPKRKAKIVGFKIITDDGKEKIAILMQYRDYKAKKEVIDIVYIENAWNFYAEESTEA